MDPIKVALAVQGGLSPICATCNKYWKAREQNVPDGRCLAVDGCGGPLVGDDFHEYEGPMTDFSRWCFVCGEDAHAVVSVKGKNRLIGVCSKHMPMLRDLKPVGRDQKSPIVVKTEDGRVLTVDEFVGPKKQSLFQKIEEIEADFRKRGK